MSHPTWDSLIMPWRTHMRINISPNDHLGFAWPELL